MKIDDAQKQTLPRCCFLIKINEHQAFLMYRESEKIFKVMKCKFMDGD
jgi:hypothetical protein